MWGSARGKGQKNGCASAAKLLQFDRGVNFFWLRLITTGETLCSRRRFPLFLAGLQKLTQLIGSGQAGASPE